MISGGAGQACRPAIAGGVLVRDFMGACVRFHAFSRDA